MYITMWRKSFLGRRKIKCNGVKVEVGFRGRRYSEKVSVM